MHKPATPSPLLDDLRALPRPFWVLFAGTFINRFGTFVMPFLTIYLWKHGYSLTAASFAVSAFGFGSLCGSTLGGYLADRIGRRNTIAVGTFASGVFYMLLYYAASYPQILACAIMAGMSAGTYPPASSALLVDVVPEERRVRAYSAIRLALNAGFACGSATAGFLAKYSFFWLFFGDALTTFLYGALALAALPHGIRSSVNRAPWSEALAHIRSNRTFHAVFAASLCLALIFSQFGSTYSAHVMSMNLSFELFGFRLTGETLYGMLLGWNGLLVVSAELPLTSLTQRFKAHHVIALGDILHGIGFLMNAVAHSAPFLFFAMTVFTVGEMVGIPVGNAYVAKLAPERMRGRYMGVMGFTWGFASMAGPPAGMQLYRIHPALPWIACGALGLMGAAAILYSGRVREELALADDETAGASARLDVVPAADQA